jgi:hypothetical protein
VQSFSLLTTLPPHHPKTSATCSREGPKGLCTATQPQPDSTSHMDASTNCPAQTAVTRSKHLWGSAHTPHSSMQHNPTCVNASNQCILQLPSMHNNCKNLPAAAAAQAAYSAALLPRPISSRHYIRQQGPHNPWQATKRSRCNNRHSRHNPAGNISNRASKTSGSEQPVGHGI